MKLYAKRNYDRHKARFKASARRWIQSNPEKRVAIMIFQNAKRRSRIKASGGRGFTIDHWRELLARTGSMCAYCLADLANSIDHFVPIARGGAHDFTNIVPSCKPCNSKKNANDPVEWITSALGVDHVERIKSILLT